MATLRKRRLKNGDVYYVDFIHEGKRHVWSTKTGIYKEAKKRLDEIRGKISRGAFNVEEYERKSVSLGQFLEEYFAYGKAHKKEKTLGLEGLYLRGLVEHFGNVGLRSITARDADQWKAAFLSRNVGGSEKRISPETFNIVLRMVRAAFNLAKKWDYIEKNVFEGVDEAQSEEKRLFLNDSEAERLFKVVSEDIAGTEDPKLRAARQKMKNFFVFLLDTGLRRGEAISLQMADVDLKENSIHIRKAKGKWERSVPLTPRARGIILDLGKELFSGVDGNYASERFRHYVRQAGLQGFKLHSLRHTFGTRLHRAGVDIYTIARLLGHRDIKTSLIYTKITADTLQGAIEKLQSMLAVTEMQQRAEEGKRDGEKG